MMTPMTTATRRASAPAVNRRGIVMMAHGIVHVEKVEFIHLD